MTHRPIRATTALAATLSLLLPQAAMVPDAQAQERVRLCEDLTTTPPCPEGERRQGRAYVVNEDGSLTRAGRGGGEEAAEAEEAPVEEAPVEEGPAEEVPAEQAAGDEAPVEEQPVEEVAPEGEAAQADAEAEAAAQAEAQAQADEEARRAAEQAAEEEAARADAEAQAQAEADAAAQAEAEAQADEDARHAAEQAAAEEAARADAEAQAQAEADAAAQAQAEAEAQADEEARRAAEEAAAEEEAAQADAAARADAEAEAGVDVQPEEQPAAQPEADGQANARAEREAAREAIRAERDRRRAEREARRQAEGEAQGEAAEAQPEDAPTAEEEAVREAAQAQRAEERAARRAAREAARAEAEAAGGEQAPVVAEEEDVDPTIEEDERPVAAAEEEAAPVEPVEEEVETLTAEDVRESDEDFATDVQGEERASADEDDDGGLSDLEKALLLGLGAVAVGSLLDNGQEVVANSGDRVVTREESGDYVVYRDDDALLRQEGATVRTQTFDDGSTRTIVERGDGTQIVTIRDAEGRVLRRARVLADGTQVVLLDDTERAEPVDVRLLREEAPEPVTLSVEDSDEETLREVFTQPVAYDPGRRFTLRQIREIAAVRNLVPGIDLDAITFASGSAAIPPDQLGDLVDLGLLLEETLDENPAEVFLVEGHTDAVGSEAFNLALSDRRAETVALALTENFAIPPENLVVQGYGEEFLRVPTEADEQENRRATIRRITPLLQLRG